MVIDEAPKSVNEFVGSFRHRNPITLSTPYKTFLDLTLKPQVNFKHSGQIVWHNFE